MTLRTDEPGTGARALTICVVLTLVVSALPLTAVPAGATTATATQSDTPRVSIQEIQKNESGSASPYQGQMVRTTGVVTATTEKGFYIQNGSAAYSGVFVASGSSEYEVGDNLTVTAPVEESFELTQLNLSASNTAVSKDGTASVPAPMTLDTGEVSKEAYEGVLVKITDLTVTATPGEFGEWKVDDGSGEVKIDDVTAGDDTVPEKVDSTIESITGPVFFSFGNFKIQPKMVKGLSGPPDEDPDLPPNAQNLTLLMYNDIQTAAANPNAMGRLVGVINERRRAHQNPTVVVGGGDQVGPSALGPFTKWKAPIGVLNVLDPAAEVVGNHDLDYGIDSVSKISSDSEFPWLLANLVKEDGSNMPGTKNYTIVNRGDIKVGIVGLVDDEIYSKTAIDFEGQGYKLADFSKVGSRIATKLKEEKNVDVVIAAAHIGIPQSKELARETENIDAIVAGDDEIKYGPKRVSGTAIVEGEGRAAYVGEVNLSVGENRVVMREDSRLISVQAKDDPSNLPINKSAKQLVQKQRQKYLTQVAGKTTVPLDSRFTNYDEETRWGNFITDAFRNRMGSEIAITNAGGIRGNFIIPAGEVTYEDIYTSLPFGNYLVEKKMTGEDIKKLLASQVEALDAQFGSSASVQVSGITYEYVDRPGAQPKVTDLYVDGEPLKMEQTYTVTVNSFMAKWDRIANKTTVETDPTQYGTVVAEYLEEQSPITPSDDDRIRRVTRSIETPPTVSLGVGANGYVRNGYTITFEAPFVTGVAAETFRVENETNAVVSATDVSLSGDVVSVTFKEDQLTSMAKHSKNIQLYGKYNDTKYNHQFLTYAKLNVNLTTMRTLGDAPATNLDSDPALEDINGDGELTTDDVAVLYQNYNTLTVRANVDLFDYNGDGEITIADLKALSEQVQATA